MVVVITLREIVITMDRLWAMKRGQVLAAEKAGKIKTVFQMTTVSVILIYFILEQAGSGKGWFGGLQHYYLLLINFLMIITVSLTITSGMSYFRNKIKGNHS
jgi:phosphatidylglycerophosphate synthase